MAEPITLQVRSDFTDTTITISHEVEYSPVGRLFANNASLLEITLKHKVIALGNKLMEETFPDGTRLTTYTRIEE